MGSMRASGVNEDINRITGDVVDAAVKVHSRLGPGLLESVYERCLAYELARRGHVVNLQVGFPVVYDEVSIDRGMVLDMLVDGEVVVEIKAVAELANEHHAQLATYLKLTGRRVGLLLNFHAVPMKEGIRRIVR